MPDIPGLHLEQGGSVCIHKYRIGTGDHRFLMTDFSRTYGTVGQKHIIGIHDGQVGVDTRGKIGNGLLQPDPVHHFTVVVNAHEVLHAQR